MPGRAILWRAAVLAGAVGGLMSHQARAEPAGSPPEMLRDAAVHDIFFLDADRGWAVGDRGLILSTEDGGRRWFICDSPVSCRLQSVTFVDGQQGWAVGGWIHPYTHKTSGVVLRTENGGRRWTRVSSDTLPQLHAVAFRNAREGWAAGDASAMYPSGCFRTSDGGRSWQTVPSTMWHAWSQVLQAGAAEPLLVGRSALGRIEADRRVSWQPLSTTAHRSLRAGRVEADHRGWLVGDGGLLMQTLDGGRQWQVRSDVETREFDFRCVATWGTSVWIGGAPGSRVLHSPDGGKTWTWFDTGHAATLEAMHFVDANHGWAVGQLGLILATRDGGRTWIRQRGQERVALLGIFGRSENIPLELLAHAAGDEGYLAAVDVVPHPTPAPGQLVESQFEDRVHEAVVGAGGVAGTVGRRFPLPASGVTLTAEALVRRWDGRLESDALRQFEAHVVRQIRTWRPDVVLTEQPGSTDKLPLAYLVNQIVLAAVPRAADATFYPEQLHAQGLAPWRVRKLFCVVSDPEQGSFRLESTRLATRLGRTVADCASRSRGLVRSQWVAPAEATGFRLLLSDLPRELAGRDLFAGLTMAPGQGVRREAASGGGADLSALGRAAQKQRNIQQLLKFATAQQGSPAAWLGQVDELLHEMEPGPAGEVLFALAQQFRQAGQIELAGETLQMLAERYPQHPLTESAWRWLAGLLGSREVQWGLFEGRVPQWGGILQDSAGPAAGAPSRLPALTTHTAAADQGRATADPGSGASSFASISRHLQQTRPALFADPLLRSASGAYHAREGQQREALHLFQQLAGTQALGIWSRCARGELWQINHTGLPPKAAARCSLTPVRPELDGVLDDPCWAGAESIPLAGASEAENAWPATVRLAFDADYLYLAIECQRPQVVDPPPAPAEARSRDADLSEADRVEILLDLDRDYASHYRLVVDHRGRTYESCYDDPRWNPPWYVAAGSQPQSWTVEAAIERRALTPGPLQRGDVWLLGLQRIVPGLGFQSWTQPATLQISPEGFGYLQFE